MPSFADDIVLAILALLLFGPKKLPVLARELGKWVAEFRRASNEFKYQMEEELRLAEQADRQKKAAEMEAAAPPVPSLNRGVETAPAPAHSETAIETFGEDVAAPDREVGVVNQLAPDSALDAANSAIAEPPTPLPIATAGSLHMMPPDTGLPVARGGENPMNPILDSIPGELPPARAEAAHHESVPETAHAD